MKEYRPDGWEERRDRCARRDFGDLALGKPVSMFETGASAMLKALRESGAIVDMTKQSLSVRMMLQVDQMLMNARDNPKGTLVFIPEDTEE